MLIVFLFSRAWISSRAREDDDAETLLIRDYQAARINKIFSDDDLRGGLLEIRAIFFFQKLLLYEMHFCKRKIKCVFFFLSFFLPSSTEYSRSHDALFTREFVTGRDTRSDFFHGSRGEINNSWTLANETVIFRSF